MTAITKIAISWTFQAHDIAIRRCCKTRALRMRSYLKWSESFLKWGLLGDQKQKLFGPAPLVECCCTIRRNMQSFSSSVGWMSLSARFPINFTSFELVSNSFLHSELPQFAHEEDETENTNRSCCHHNLPCLRFA